MFLVRLTQALDRAKVDYALVGGLAVALHGAMRGTVDIDLVLRLSRKDFLKAESTFQELGLEAKLPVNGGQVFDFREEYIRDRNLIAWSFFNPNHPGEVVDVIITHDLAKMKTKSIDLRGQKIRVLALDDLIRMKQVSGRPQDKEDVKSLKFIKKKGVR